MFVYIVAIFSTLLSFMALLSCLRFLFSRQCIFWIIPFCISIILLYQNLNNLLFYGELENSRISFSLILPAFLSLFWYALVVIFHYALKLAIPENKYINDSKKNLKEAMYLEKYEMRKNKRNREVYTKSITGKNSVPTLPEIHNGKLVD